MQNSCLVSLQAKCGFVFVICWFVFVFFCSKESENDEVFVRHSQVGIFGVFCFSFVGSEQAFY